MPKYDPNPGEFNNPRERYAYVVGYANGYLGKPRTDTIKSRQWPGAYNLGERKGRMDAR